MTATRPEPVLNWARVVANWQRITAAVVAFVTAGGGVAVAVGLANDGQVQNIANGVAGVLAGVGTVLAVVMPLWGAHTTKAVAAQVREQVTPLESPRNNDGVALVEASYGRHEAQMVEDVSASMGPDLPA